VSFLSSPRNRGPSRCIGTDGLQQLCDAATPNPLRTRRGLDVLGTGDRGWRPYGLTPGYCLKPFQGFEGGLGKGRGSPELMTSSEVMEGLDEGWDVSSQMDRGWDVSSQKDRGWDVSSQKVLGCEGGEGFG
jgi:hypothetical protein